MIICLVQLCRAALAACVFLCLPAFCAAPAQGLEFAFDFEFAKLVSQAVNSQHFDEKSRAAIRALPATAGMVKKMHLKDADALIEHLRKLPANPTVKEAAAIVSVELAKQNAGTYAAVADEVRRQLRQYVPAEFAGRYRVLFVFGSGSMGFAFSEDPVNVYVDLAKFSTATTQELAETVAHELFHALQINVMPPSPGSSVAPVSPGLSTAAAGAAWTNRLLYDLLQEATAELLNHPIVDRPDTAFSQRIRHRFERNAKRLPGLVALLETMGHRLYYAPPRDEAAYDRIYSLMFYMSFDETAYDLGWVMANAIEKKEGKAAIMGLLKQSPKHFVLRYQAIAEKDAALPKFSEEFLRIVRTLPEL